MKLMKILLTGVVAAAMMSTSCSSDSNDEANTDLSTDTVVVNDEHPADSEHPASSEHPENSEHPANSENSEHPSNGDEHPSADSEHPASTSKTTVVVEKEEVKLALLPPAISEVLKSQEYVSYKYERAFEVKHEDGSMTYEVSAKKDGVASKMVFNAEGVRVDKK